MTLKEAIEKHGLSVKSEFVPFSKSRNAKPNPRLKDFSLNWKVTLLQEDREILTTDYMMGAANAPSYKFKRSYTVSEVETLKWECENGYPAWIGHGLCHRPGSKPLQPKAEDVIYSLLTDAEAIDYPTYEDWADNVGFDQDSRKGEAAYRACLQIALTLRASLGEASLRELREAAQEY